MQYPHKESLEQLILDVGEVAERIYRISQYIPLINDNKLQNHYQIEYDNIIDLYLLLCEFLEKELEKAIKFEKENKLPSTLGYHQLLKQIQSTLNKFTSDSF